MADKLAKEALEELLKGRAALAERTAHELARVDFVIQLVRNELSKPSYAEEK